MHLDEPLPKRYVRYLSDPGAPRPRHVVRHRVAGVEVDPRSAHRIRFVSRRRRWRSRWCWEWESACIAAWKRGSPLDYLLVGGAVVGVSMPVFWLGVLLIYVFSARFGLLPASGFGDGNLAYLVLPALTLSQASTAYVARITRSSVLDEVGENYVKAARAKGLSEPRLLVRHALRNALLPIITVVGVDFGSYPERRGTHRIDLRVARPRALHARRILKRDLPRFRARCCSWRRRSWP
jgi:hypothetical protein